MVDRKSSSIEVLRSCAGLETVDFDYYSAALNFPGSQKSDNERLEFLGDAILDLFVALWLVTHENHCEGAMTRVRANVVSKNGLLKTVLAQSVRDLFESFGRQDSDRQIADTVESIVGAVYLDRGHDYTFEWLGRWMEPTLVNELKLLKLNEEDADGGTQPELGNRFAPRDGSAPVDYNNPKNKLQEFMQQRRLGFPRYDTTREGPDHDPSFISETCSTIGDCAFCGKGSGKNKREAEMAAATKLLAKLLGNQTALTHGSTERDKGESGVLTSNTETESADPSDLDNRHIHPKIALNECLMKMGLHPARFEIKTMQGLAHCPNIEVAGKVVLADGTIHTACGEGHSRREAEKNAAASLLEALVDAGICHL